MHTSSVWVKLIIGNHSFNHTAKASHHSLIHFVPPKKNKKKKKEHRDGCQSLLSARGRWRATRAPAGLIPLSVREAWVPMSEDEGRRGGDRETLAAKCVA